MPLSLQDQQSRELSQGHIARKAKRLKVTEAEVKLPKVIGMDACEVRVWIEEDSDNGHQAYTVWRLHDWPSLTCLAVSLHKVTEK